MVSFTACAARRDGSSSVLRPDGRVFSDERDRRANSVGDEGGGRTLKHYYVQVVKACRQGTRHCAAGISRTTNACVKNRRSDIAIDEMVTGSFHMTSLEALAQGLPTFAYLDSRSLDTLSELTGAHTHPWLNFRLEEAEEPLAELIKDGELRREMGTFARDWMEKYYNDREMVSHYVRAYEDLLERPEAFKKPRFDTW